MMKPINTAPEPSWSTSGWTYRRVDEVCDLGRGRVISQEDIQRHSGIYPVFSSQSKDDGVFGYLDSYDFEGDYVTRTTDGANSGTVFFRTGRFNCTNVCGTLKPKSSNTNARFLARILSEVAKRHVSYVGNPKLMNNVMAAIQIRLPPRSVQDYVAAVLDTVDDAISKMEAVIAKLKRVRAGLLHDLLTRGLDKHGQLRDPIAHPEQFQDSSLGPIPREWDARPLDLVGRWAGGKTPSKDNAEFWYQGEILWVTPKDVKFDKVEDTEDKLSVLGASTMEIFRAGSLLVVGRSGILRHSLPVAIATKPFTVSQDLKVLVPFVADETTALFLRLVLVSREQEILRKSMKIGTTVESVDWPAFKSLMVGWPGPLERRMICDSVSKVDADITYNVSELGKLVLLKSGLMTDLLTGRVRVPEDIMVAP